MAFRSSVRAVAQGSLVGLLALAPRLAHAQTEPAPPAPTEAAPAAPAAPATPGPTEDPAVRARLDEIDQRSRILERKLELADEDQAKRLKETPVLAAGDKGFSITSPDKAYTVKIKGLLQADGRFFLDDPALGAKDQFLIRKARPYVDATLGNLADFRIMADFTSTSAPIQDAYIDFHPWTFLKLRVGKFKSPIGLERLQNDAAVKFIERSFTSSVAPNRDVGVQLHGDILGGAIYYALAAFDGAPDGGSVDGDVSFAKDFVGRLFLQPFKNDPYSALNGLGIGVAGSTGNQKASTAAPGLSGYVTAGQQSFFAYLSDSKDATNTPFANKRRDRIAPQLYWFVGPFGLLAEHVISRHTVEKKGTRTKLANQATLVQASYVLTGDANTYDGVQVKENFDPAKGTWGSLELSARFNQLKIDDDTFPTFADPNAAVHRARGWAVALFWNWTRNLAWEVNYEQTIFQGGAAAGTDRKTENVLITRAQANF
jgi:phosphate-selective porin OprO/OprP